MNRPEEVPAVTVTGNEGRVVEVPVVVRQPGERVPPEYIQPDDVRLPNGSPPWLRAVVALQAALRAKREAYRAYDTGQPGSLAPYEQAGVNVERATEALHKALMP